MRVREARQMKLRARLFRARVLEKVEASVLRAAEKIGRAVAIERARLYPEAVGLLTSVGKREAGPGFL